ncbi:hypothetical protein [Leucothrix arctica]|uniref:Uncharacterized protein n=1 Tax=Leucothrix arctica TaxID=1481894 RepID=A0A317C6M1_9GAMM|nr:hypothetical protein [Leucothrix arctica]PWQ94274.1 hypothetical protein DKT75_16060 [Leucothrix arctica]
MKNYILITIPLIAVLGLSACSTQSTNSNQTKIVKSIPKVIPQASNQVTSNNNNYALSNAARNQQIANQQRQIALQKQKEKENQQARLAYNQTWQNQQAAQKRNAQSQANNNRLAAQRQAQAKITQSRARNAWQQQQATQKQQLAQIQRQQQKQQQLAMLQQRQQQQRYQQPPESTQGSAGISGLTDSEIRSIGDKIFKNESGGNIANLVHWNNGENFASMGIGHFTWYPAGRRARFGNTFPGLLDHLKANGVQLPVWVQQARYSGAPWRTKNELGSAKHSRQVKELQNLLYQTRYIQATYIFDRAKRAMPRVVKATPTHLKGLVGQNLNAVANTRGGWYALIDYVNFKGEGLSRNGGYKGQNWGLLQVLENMRPSQPGQQALNNFADSATAILQRRVRNSDPRRNEAKWMRGWTIRINTYRHPFVI